MGNHKLWNLLNELKTPTYKWVDLTHELSETTPHWYGFAPFKKEILFDYLEDTPQAQLAPMRCFSYTVASQYGTHVDAPNHFIEGGRSLSKIEVSELIYPLVVIDKVKECAENPEFTLQISDLQDWEKIYGRIPENAFVAFRSDWHKKENLDNPDENVKPHYPGWSVEALTWLVQERNIGAIGHEPADTDPSYVTTDSGHYPYPAEKYILEVDRFQIEVLRNLDQLPATGGIIVTAFPRIKEGVGSPARVFAIVPND